MSPVVTASQFALQGESLSKDTVSNREDNRAASDGLESWNTTVLKHWLSSQVGCVPRCVDSALIDEEAAGEIGNDADNSDTTPGRQGGRVR